MSYCKNEGKDRVIFATEEDHSTPSKVSFPENDEDDTPAGLLLPNGEINWSCPCLGGMATGPCGVEFRDSFTCFHYSTEDPKGSECLDAFRTMSECMSQYPGVYGSKNDDEDIFKDNEDELKEDLPEEDSKESSVKSSSSHDSNDSSSLSKEVVKS